MCLKNQTFARERLEGSHVKFEGLLGLEISFCHGNTERTVFVRFRGLLKDLLYEASRI